MAQGTRLNLKSGLVLYKISIVTCHLFSDICSLFLCLIPYTLNLIPLYFQQPATINDLNDPNDKNHLNDSNDLNDPNELNDLNDPNELNDPNDLNHLNELNRIHP